MDAAEPVLMADNRGFRYGDGLFETMKMISGRILLEDLHFDRLFTSLQILKYNLPSFFTASLLKQQVLKLCSENNCEMLSRIRFTVFRGNGGLQDHDNSPHYLIECWPLSDTINQLNHDGLVIDTYPYARKSCDILSSLKSANFLPYVMAADYALKNKLNDCLILNTNNGIADATIANVFIVKDGIIKTPSLTDGCVNGVMRKYLLGKLSAEGYKIVEGAIIENDLLSADEIFLTNAISGIRWVKKFREKTYSDNLIRIIYDRFVRSIYFLNK